VPPDHLLALPFSFTATGGGTTRSSTYSTDSKLASVLLSTSKLSDGTPVSVTFGPEVPALAGKTVTLPAVETTLVAPARKPLDGIELRGYAPGTDFPVDWGSVSGTKILMGVDAHVQPLNLLMCWPIADTATTFTVPASDMSTITSGADPATQFPGFYVISSMDAVETVGTIKIKKHSASELFFQLNLNP
jgi:hypothetical protein